MEINGLSTDLHMPDAPKGEGVHRLPPCCLQTAYKVDEYPACPDTWMHGSAKAASYFVAIEPGKHLWLDFRKNWSHTHHVAIVCSVQGLNPQTGQFIEKLILQQFRENCPVHDEPFGADRFCQKCHETEGLPSKWQPQNYMTTVSHKRTGTQNLWADGWYKDEGKIDGFLVTEETIRGIAAQAEELEHNKDKERVFAIGIAFFLSKEPKPQPKMTRETLRKTYYQVMPLPVLLVDPAFGSGEMKSAGGYLRGTSKSLRARKYGSSGGADLDMADEMRGLDDERGVEQLSDRDVTKLEIAGGATIQQQLCWLDPSEPGFYKDEPDGLIYVNYCLPEELRRIVEAGKREVSGGFTSGLRTGNP